MMFSRIMEKLKKNSVDTGESPNSPSQLYDFQFPVSSLEELQKIDACCGENATAMKILV